ncbi:MAG TPA: hypothetical protein VK465_05590, partial [Fibrobacteria bacterium]|nr:hypothetical protein [Fibrobacteria bacterium]
MGHRTEYAYDARDNRISQKDADNHVTTMEYDALNRMVRKEYPNGDEERWTYNANGQATSHVKGTDSTAYQFDAMDREVFREHFPSGHEVRTTYTADGKRDTVVDYRGTTTYAYDSRGRLHKETQANGDTLVHDYDAQGNRIRLRTPFGETRYGYDALNRMDSVTSPRNQVTAYHYNPVGNLDSVVHANGTRVGYSHDLLNRLTEVRNWGSAGTLVSRHTYLLNDAGIRTQVTELDGSVVTYAHDDLYRLTGETRTGSHPYVRAHGYDNVGNRLFQVKDGDTTAYAYNSRDQLTLEESSGNSIEYGYDAAG